MINSFSNHASVKFIQSLNLNTSFNFTTVSVGEIRNILLHLNVKKSTGHDNIPPKLLKIGADILCYPIQSILNNCIECCIFPDTLKLAEISPVYTKGNYLDICNYRHISILTCVSKIFEKVLVQQLSEYFENKCSESMSGFRKGYSCQDVLIRFIEKCKQRADNGIISGAVLTDLSKAFDILNHGLFIGK